MIKLWEPLVTMTPTPQSACDLQLNLIEGPLNEWTQFQILQSSGLSLGPWDVSAHVIGASHLISIRHDDLCFHEIFACMEVISDARQIFCRPMAQTGNLVHWFSDRIEYTFKPEKMDWRAGVSVMADLEQRVNNPSGDCIGLSVGFAPIDGGAVPKTIVLVEPDNHALRFETVHSYPNEACIVFTDTRIKETSWS
jgi:hypothetical protein